MARTGYYAVLFIEAVLVALIAVLLLVYPLCLKLSLGGCLPNCADHWLSCFTLEHQLTRILGINPGGLWDGGYFYPFNKISMLLNEPSWGVSLAVLPFWLIFKDIFLINNFGGVVALLLSWLAVYYFAKTLGMNWAYALFSSFTFCLSAVSLSLILDVYFFWPFFLIPLLGVLAFRMIRSPRAIWAIAFGLAFAYLSWSAAQLTVMGGSFLILFMIWLIRDTRNIKRVLPSLCLAFLISSLPALILYVPMLIVHRQQAVINSVPEQIILYNTNFVNVIFTDKLWQRPLSAFHNFSFWNTLSAQAKGETSIGISAIVLLCALSFFFYYLFKGGAGKIKGSGFFKLALWCSAPLLLAGVNICILKIAVAPRHFSQIAIARTFLFYGVFGLLAIILRHRVSSALKRLPFFFFLYALFALSLAFGSYYLTADGRAIPSPTILFSAVLPGFSGIRATARWGLIFSFAMSIGVFLALGHLKKSKIKILFTIVIMLFSFTELFLGLPPRGLQQAGLHQWQPSRVDLYLKNAPGAGSVLEVSSYPFPITSEGAYIYSSLYYHRPVVIGYSTIIPKIHGYYLYAQERGWSDTTSSSLRKFGARFWVVHNKGGINGEIVKDIEKNPQFKGLAFFSGEDIYIFEDLHPVIDIDSLEDDYGKG